MNRARALLICARPQNYMPAPVQEAAAYLQAMSGAMEDERRPASEAIAWLRSKRDASREAALLSLGLNIAAVHAALPSKTAGHAGKTSRPHM
jgi:hypothetical protein